MSAAALEETVLHYESARWQVRYEVTDGDPGVVEIRCANAWLLAPDYFTDRVIEGLNEKLTEEYADLQADLALSARIAAYGRAAA